MGDLFGCISMSYVIFSIWQEPQARDSSRLFPLLSPKKQPQNWTQINKNRIISTFFGLILHIEKVPYFTSKTPFSPPSQTTKRDVLAPFSLIWIGSPTLDHHSRLQIRATAGIANDDICVGDMKEIAVTKVQQIRHFFEKNTEKLQKLPFCHLHFTLLFV